MSETFDPSSNTPSSPAQPDRTYPVAKAVAIGLGVAILVAIAVIIYGISAGWGHRSDPKPKAPVSMTLAPGYRILSSDTQPGRLILRVRNENIDEIWVINTDDGSIVARIHGETPP